MMRLLHWVLSPPSALPSFPPDWGTPPPDCLHDAQFSALYSDVGGQFYYDCGPTLLHTGWQSTDAVNTSWDLTTHWDFTIGSLAPDISREHWKWLSAEDADRAWERDSKLMLNDAASEAQSTGKTVFSFLPVGGVGQYNIQRHMSFTSDLKPILPDTWGIMRVHKDQHLSLATWTFEPGTKTMVLTRLRVTEEDFPPLMELLKQAALKLDKDTIETWNLPDDLKSIAGQMGGRTFERSDHLSAAKWYGPEAHDKPRWLFNEKSV